MQSKDKYVTVKIGIVITQVAKETEIKGYTEGVIEIFFPDDNVINAWSDEEEMAWVKENNTRMEAICKFLNESNL